MQCDKLVSCSLFVVLLLFLSPYVVGAEPFEDHSPAAQAGLVVSASAVSVPYFVAKTAYALSGSLVAGGINLFSLGFAQDTATRVGTQAVNGDWIVHPTVFTGERSLQFTGSDAPVRPPAVTMVQGG